MSLPYKRLSGFYFFWFASLGVLVPYWGLYMQDHGYRPTEIGAIFAILMTTKMVAPNIWGWIADHYGGRIRIIRVATGLATLAFLCIPFVNGFVLMALCMVGYGFFSNAALPQFEAITLNHLGVEEGRYGRIRLWGSVGFILSVAALGPVLDAWGTAPVPMWTIACLAGLFVVSLSVPEPGNGTNTPGTARFWQLLLRRDVMGLFGVCFLSQLSHAPYYAFFSIYMQENGYDHSMIGGLWAVGVIAEIGVFAFLPALLAHADLRRLMLVAMAVTTLRWILLALFPQQPALVLLAQLMHLGVNSRNGKNRTLVRRETGKE